MINMMLVYHVHKWSHDGLYDTITPTIGGQYKYEKNFNSSRWDYRTAFY
jgi:hypothetical protein